MEKKGKSLEKLVKLIHEALKDNDNTEVLSNVKLKDQNGGMREIDVLIKSKVHGVDLLIAVECKDYKRPVSIDKLDAFKAKCDSIPEINKKIFVSTSGYASGAKRNSVSYGISLYQISDLSPGSILSWFPINKLNLKLQIVNVRYGFGIRNKEQLNEIKSVKPQLYCDNKVICDHINEFIQNEVYSNRKVFWGQTLHEFMRDKKKALNEGITQECEINFPTGYSLIDNHNKHVPLNQFLISVNTSLVESSLQITSSTSYSELEKEETTRQMSVAIGHNTHAEIVKVGDEKYEMFIRDVSGELTQLSTLAVYDPIEDKLISLL